MKRVVGIAGALGLIVSPALGQTYLPFGTYLSSERPAADCDTTHGFPWCPSAGIGVDGEVVYKSQWSAAGTQEVRFFTGQIEYGSGHGTGGFFTLATDPKVYGGKKPPLPVCFVSMAAETAPFHDTGLGYLYGYPPPPPGFVVWQERPGDGSNGLPLTSATVTFGWWSPFVAVASYTVYPFNVICKPNTP